MSTARCPRSSGSAATIRALYAAQRRISSSRSSGDPRPGLPPANELPQPPAGEEARLHDLGEPGRPLPQRQRLDRRRVAHDPLRLMERSDGVLGLGQVDGRLPADAGIHHPRERRRHRDPRDAPQVGRRHEPRDVGRRAAAEPDDDVAALDAEVGQARPRLPRDGHGLGRLARREGGRSRAGRSAARARAARPGRR